MRRCPRCFSSKGFIHLCLSEDEEEYILYGICANCGYGFSVAILPHLYRQYFGMGVGTVADEAHAILEQVS